MSPSEYQDLITFLGERFESIDQRFESIDQRFEAIDGRFEAIDRTLGELRAEILGHFDELYRRLERRSSTTHLLLGDAVMRAPSIVPSAPREILAQTPPRSAAVPPESVSMSRRRV